MCESLYICPVEINENNILVYLKKGEEKAYKYLFDHHYAILCHIAESIVHNDSIAEDVVCEVFLRIYEIRDCLEIHTSLKHYLVSAVRNRALNSLTHIKKHAHDGLEESMEIQSAADEDVIAGELKTMLDSSISGLSPECRMVFEKSRNEGMSYQEIAQELGISVNTVKYHMKHALAAIRKDVGKYMSSVVLILTTLLSS